MLPCSLNSSSGAITVSGPLDHSEAAVMILTVRATDTNAATGQQSDTSQYTHATLTSLQASRATPVSTLTRH